MTTLARYEQVGNVGPTLEAPYWLGAPPGTTQFIPGGGVTLVEFTEQGCASCRASYPGLAKLQQRYVARGLQLLLDIQLFEKDDTMKTKEIARDSAFYLQKYALPAQIALSPATRHEGEWYHLSADEFNYHVREWPQIVLLDRAGRVRMVVIGWNPASEARLGTMIEHLLAEPTPRQRPAPQ